MYKEEKIYRKKEIVKLFSSYDLQLYLTSDTKRGKNQQKLGVLALVKTER